MRVLEVNFKRSLVAFGYMPLMWGITLLGVSTAARAENVAKAPATVPPEFASALQSFAHAVNLPSRIRFEASETEAEVLVASPPSAPLNEKADVGRKPAPILTNSIGTITFLRDDDRFRVEQQLVPATLLRPNYPDRNSFYTVLLQNGRCFSYSVEKFPNAAARSVLEVDRDQEWGLGHTLAGLQSGQVLDGYRVGDHGTLYAAMMAGQDQRITSSADPTTGEPLYVLQAQTPEGHHVLTLNRNTFMPTRFEIEKSPDDLVYGTTLRARGEVKRQVVVDEFEVQNVGGRPLLIACRTVRGIWTRNGYARQMIAKYRRHDVDLNPNVSDSAFSLGAPDGTKAFVYEKGRKVDDSGLEYEWRDGNVVPALGGMPSRKSTEP